MNRKIRPMLSLGVAIGVLATLISGPAAAEPALGDAPGIIDLGTLPGGTWSAPAAINDAGVVVGRSNRADGQYRAVRWSPDGAITQLADLGNDADTFAINAAGTIAGSAYTFDGLLRVPVLWNAAGELTELELVAGTRNAYARDINDEGIAAGDVELPDGLWRAVRWDRDRRGIVLEVLPDTRWSFAFAINAHGVTAGLVVLNDARTYAVRWDRMGRITRLPTLPGAVFDSTTGADINQRGTVVGSSTSAGGESHGARWDRRGEVTDLAAFSTATSINNREVVVGEAFTGGTWRAMRWKDGQFTDLGALPGHERSHAEGINDAGTVIGRSSLWNQREERAVRWDRQGRIADLGVLPGHTTSTTIALNATGTTVGWSAGPSETHAVRWRG